MKKKTVSIMVAATMALSLFAGCGSSKDTATEDTSKTESTETTDESSENASAETTDESSRTTFTVGFDAEYPPYGYMDDDGEYTGFDLELAQAVCDKEGWELVKKPIKLGFQRYGTEFRIHRLYLEWIYHERKRR